MKGYIAQRVAGHPTRLAAISYIGALVAVVVGTLLAFWLQSVLDASVVLLLAILVAAWFSGFWPALLASVVATFALDYFFEPPLHTFTLELAHVPHLLVFTLIAGVFVTISAGRRGAERSLEQARDELELKVLERTADLTAAHGAAVAAQQRFSELVNSIEGIVWEADAHTFQFTFVSRHAERILGYSVAQWLEQPTFWKDHVHPEDRESAVNAWGTATTQKRDHDFEYRMVAADGRVVWLRDLVGVVVENGRSARLRGVMLDVTARKRAEQELEELAGRLIHAQEEERSRIGRELHDHISQMLGVLTIRMDQLRADEATPPAMAAALEELRQSTAEITDDIHGLSHRLHSSTLDYLGLAPALQKLVSEFSARHGITIDFQYRALPALLPSDVALCLFRVSEESLTNIAKHSHAKSARLHVNGAADGIHLTVEDSGSGFDPESLERRAGLGFVSMRERLRVLRGTVRVDSAPSRGTTIDIWVPATSLVAVTAGAAAHGARLPAQPSSDAGSA